MDKNQNYTTPEVEIVELFTENCILDGSGKRRGYDGDDEEEWY